MTLYSHWFILWEATFASMSFSKHWWSLKKKTMYELPKNTLNSSRGRIPGWKTCTVVGTVTFPLLDERIIFSNDSCLCRTHPPLHSKGDHSKSHQFFQAYQRLFHGCFQDNMSQCLFFLLFLHRWEILLLWHLFLPVKREMEGALGELCCTDQTQTSRCGSWKTCYQFSRVSAQVISVAWDISNAQRWITISLNNFPEVMGSVSSESPPETENRSQKSQRCYTCTDHIKYSGRHKKKCACVCVCNLLMLSLY